MPSFANYNNVQGEFSEGFKQLEPGAYVVKIMAIRTEWTEKDYQTWTDRQCSVRNDSAIQFIYDIAEGEFAGEFSRDFYMKNGAPDIDKDFLHSFIFRWGDLNDERDAKKAKYTLDCFTASNPGFDALAAFTADKWQLFIGKRFGVVLNGTVKTNDRGYDQWNLRTSVKPYSVDDIHSGNHAEPRITDKRTKIDVPETSTTVAAADSGAGFYDDIPFM